MGYEGMGVGAIGWCIGVWGQGVVGEKMGCNGASGGVGAIGVWGRVGQNFNLVLVVCFIFIVGSFVKVYGNKNKIIFNKSMIHIYLSKQHKMVIK